MRYKTQPRISHQVPCVRMLNMLIYYNYLSLKSRKFKINKWNKKRFWNIRFIKAVFFSFSLPRIEVDDLWRRWRKESIFLFTKSQGPWVKILVYCSDYLLESIQLIFTQFRVIFFIIFKKRVWKIYFSGESLFLYTYHKL